MKIISVAVNVESWLWRVIGVEGRGEEGCVVMELE